jgi:hypothetical protein
MKRFMNAAAIVLLPLAASAATLVVPAAGTGPGANGSQWKSNLTIHNTSASVVNATLIYHDSNGTDATPSTLTVAPRATATAADLVRTRFGRTSGTGAVEIVVDDSVARKIAVTSRTYNTSPAGEFGQDIPALGVNEAAAAGDMIVLQAPSDPLSYRFNLGLYAVSDATVRFELAHADGTQASATPTLDLKGGVQRQINDAVRSLFAAEPLADDAVHVFVTAGKVLAYGSAVNNASGDPTFVPAIDARQDIAINFVGVDLHESGKVDIRDANHDGVLDAPIDLYAAGFPNYFRIVIDSPEKPVFEIVDSTRDAILADSNGTVSWAVPGDLRGTTATLKVKVTVGGKSVIISIPANFK